MFDISRMIDFAKMKIKSICRNGVTISGQVQIRCIGPDGKIRWTETFKNLVVTTGLNHIADQLSDQGESAMSHMAGGSDNTAPTAGQTALLSQLGSRVTFDSVTQTGGNTVVYVATFGAGVATGTWEEAGVFNAAASGVMLNRWLTGTKVKAAAETFEVTLTLTISAS